MGFLWGYILMGKIKIQREYEGDDRVSRTLTREWIAMIVTAQPCQILEDIRIGSKCALLGIFIFGTGSTLERQDERRRPLACLELASKEKKTTRFGKQSLLNFSRSVHIE